MSIETKAPRNYLNNRDLLAEIHKSKSTFCYFTDPKYADFDIIVKTKEEIPAVVGETILRRAKRLNVKPEQVLISDLVFRVVSWAHIPEAPPKVSSKIAKKSKVINEEVFSEDSEYEIDEPVLDVKYVKLNFPPFEHYRILQNGELDLVGRSHWKGDLKTGEFCRDHGKVTKKLATMWMKICERYASRGNYRGYSFRDEMTAQGMIQLCVVGLQFDESKSDIPNPFAYYTAVVTNAFNRVLNIEKKNRDIRDDLMQDAGLDPSYTRQGEVSDYGGDD